MSIDNRIIAGQIATLERTGDAINNTHADIYRARQGAGIVEQMLTSYGFPEHAQKFAKMHRRMCRLFKYASALTDSTLATLRQRREALKNQITQNQNRKQ